LRKHFLMVLRWIQIFCSMWRNNMSEQSRNMAGCMIEEHIVALVGLVQTIISKNIAKYFAR
jgi:hypothetical protein